jgi:hypothetical protein
MSKGRDGSRIWIDRIPDRYSNASRSRRVRRYNTENVEFGFL